MSKFFILHCQKKLLKEVNDFRIFPVGGKVKNFRNGKQDMAQEIYKKLFIGSDQLVIA